MITKILTGRNEDKTLFNITEYFTIFGFNIFKWKEIGIFTIEDIIKNKKLGFKYYTFLNNKIQPVTLVKTKFRCYLRSEGNNSDKDNINNIPIMI